MRFEEFGIPADIVPPERVEKALKGAEWLGEYVYGCYDEVSVLVYIKRDSRGRRRKIYVVRNNATGAVKLITNSWKRADSLAKAIAARYGALEDYYFSDRPNGAAPSF